MFSTRIISFFFLLATFGLFVCAKPVIMDGLVARDSLEVVGRASDLIARSGTCNTKGMLETIFCS